MSLDSLIELQEKQKNTEQELKTELKEKASALICDIKAGKSTGDKFIDAALLGYERFSPNDVISLIKNVRSQRRNLEAHRGEKILISYNTSGAMIRSGGVTGLNPAEYDLDFGACWGTISKEGDVFLVERNEDTDDAKYTPYLFYINTGGEHWHKKEPGVWSRREPTLTQQKYNLPCGAFFIEMYIDKYCILPTNHQIFFGDDAEKQIQIHSNHKD